jgi:putative methionine-R-sulfoxide reductase with GAF domain
MMPTEDGSHLYIAAATGVPEEVVESTRIPIGDRVCGKVFQEGQFLHVHDMQADKGGPHLPMAGKAFMSAPLLLSGLRWGSVRVGVLSVTSPSGGGDFSIDDEFVMSNICHVAAVTIHNQMAVEEVRQANVALLETLVKAIEARDEYTSGHSERVCEFALAIGRKLELDAKSLDTLRIAARLHDIGKIGTPDAILRKPQKLTDEERQVIERHPQIAAEMLAEASVITSAVEAILYHHERFDGDGYSGKREEDIPLLSRIISVADVFDALTSTRPYRNAWSVNEAMEELKRERGRQLDPRCANAMLEIIGSGGLAGLISAPGTPASAVASRS